MPKINLTVVDPEKEVPVEVLASAIVAMSEGTAKLLAGPLTMRAIVLLIQDAAPVTLSQKQIEAVFSGMLHLRHRYVK